MRHFEGRLLLSAGDLTAFLGCRHASALDHRALGGDPGLVADEGGADPTLDLVKRKGLEHEAAYLDRLKAAGRQVVQIPDGFDLRARFAATEAAMRAGAEVIYQAALARGGWHGFADFLLRVAAPAAPWGFAYEVADTKLASRAQPKHAVQLALYADLVAAVQGVPPPALRVMLGNDREDVIRPEDVLHYVRLAGRRLEDFIAAGANGTAAEPCGQCGLCRWSGRCDDAWERDDHLSLVANIRGSQIRRLQAAGVTTVAALAALPQDRRIPGMAAETLAKLRAQAALQAAARLDGKRRHEVLDPGPGRGFARLPAPSPGDLFFDMEGDPLVPEGGLEYLFGVERGGDFRAFWAHDRAQERTALAGFLDFVAATLDRHPGAHVYHYGHYEPTALRRLAMRHATREAALDDLLRRRRFVDLYAVVREQLRISEPRYSLKNVERFFMPERGGEVANAGDSIVAYEAWLASRDGNILSEIEAYNRIDCRSTAALRDWLLGLRPARLAWFDAAAPAPDAAALERQRQAEAESAALEAALLAGAPEAERPFRRLVAQLCEFHRREQKPQWWAVFDRQLRDEEELVDDAECLGALRAAGPSRQNGGSLVRAYRFPEQETKLAKGDRPTIAATAEPAGQIASLDIDAGRLELRRGAAAGDLPDTLSLGPGAPINDAVPRAAVRRYAAVAAAGGSRFRAVDSILRREVPRLRGRVAGTPVVAPGEEPIAAATAAVLALDESHLFIQGPPGTGKTYTASRIVVELLRQGKRVAIASHAHKAINNLLAGVEDAARAAGVTFAGVKKAGTGSPEQAFDGEFIRTVTGNEDVPGDADLVAGTAWLFAREEHEQAFDLLVVDEAGQVSLGNLIAMGTAARNILLVGDQMQLGQPIQGAHPEGSGVSALEHLLQGRATVPPERGVFLDVSWRMHPDLCGWVSSAIYEGRLRAHRDTGRQALLLDGATHPALAPSGLRFHPVAHEGRGQGCLEEVAEIAAIWHALQGARWRDRRGKVRRIGPADVLVVAPYNVQVNALLRRLPEGARVGTVDRFQGQEAPVVLVSMTTSSGEEMPRGAAFLFSRNRLNVAVSRAKCLAVVLASPRLLEVPCGSLEELALVNTLCSAFAWRGVDGAPDPGIEPGWRMRNTEPP